ncbi:MAG: putative bifunctional DNA primase/polymerase [Prokaryotic dsDNA virus sp.]|nr:MAG: putative bifunctional DNA primase/polymerase [Prokaryotic dsDNA virus sp.]|tara:strand:+ start:3369 stop:4244 length:876 start_codon:yes stop_codon:yes gene_type:complete
MIISKGSSIHYLQAYKEGKIKIGLDTGTRLDDFLRFKKRQLNIILGHDNVGKTYWFEWYMLVLALRHNITFCIWSGENSSGQILRDMIQMYKGVPFKELSMSEIQSATAYLEQYFTFIDNRKLYKPEELLEIFEETECDACFIDPFTGLDREMTYEGNYKFLNICRQFCNLTGKTLYISSHPNSESGRTSNIYPENHEWQGQLKPPLKAHIEGGKAFLNRCDDMITIHRLVSSPTMKYETMIFVEKIKDKETGGQLTDYSMPLLFNFNSGFGFKIFGVDTLERHRKKQTII